MIGNFFNQIKNFPFIVRRFILILIDSIIIQFSFFFSILIIYGNQIDKILLKFFWMIPASLCLGILLYIFTGQYKSISRYKDNRSIYLSAFRTLILLIFLILFGVLNSFEIASKPFYIIFYFIVFFLTSGIRLVISDVLRLASIKTNKDIPKVAIYGAGAAGATLAMTLRLEGSHQVQFFVDDNPDLWNRSLNGLKIYPPSRLDILKNKLDQLLLAIPSASSQSRQLIIKSLKQKNIKVMQIPSIQDLTNGRATIDKLIPISIDDLLGRESVRPEKDLLGPGIVNSVVLITGAGGSIGSELARQIIPLKPSKIILLEHSEIALYSINEELKNQTKNIDILPILGSASDYALVINLFKDHNVDLVFHAAAYKHVPLVESNPIQGIKNNIISTKLICEASTNSNVKNMLLISSDKAVRPTNIMGASKRLAELIVQSYAEEEKLKAIKNGHGYKKKCFSMVRFGNVIGSSGSVIPLFKKQIELGGPITLTHENIYRFFMSIQEAVQLVIQSSVLAEGGDVLLLDMGQPIKIKELAKQMVELSGLSIKDAENPDGDIELINTGLRPGEKLYEELLIEATSEKTIHPLIFRAFEKNISPDIFWPKYKSLEEQIKNNDEDRVLEELKNLVPEWRRSF